MDAELMSKKTLIEKNNQLSNHCLLACSIISFGLMTGNLSAQDLSPQSPQGMFVSPLQDDATIKDVAFASAEILWAVGDHGVVWKSLDAGRTWNLVSVAPGMENFSFESVQFLTDRVGWIAGGAVSSVGRVHHGIVLATTDGGTTWNILSQAELPYLRQIHFSDLENGIAIGERTSKYSAGITSTNDGGQTWTPLQHEKNARWQSAAFFNDAAGLLVGDQGRQAVFSDGKILPGGGNIGGLQAFHDVAVRRDGTCWMIGDGGLVLHSSDYGVTWSPPNSDFSKDVRDITDFECVETKGSHIWISGSPGSVIWHSADDGMTWEKQLTGSSSPLKKIRFRDSQHGVATGLFGRICVTNNAGKTWNEMRGANRHLAFWALHGHKSRVPYSFLTRWSGEAGYRSGVTVTSRRDQGFDAFQSEEEQLYLEQAVLAAGGNQARIDWRLPVSLPGLDRDQDKLAEDFSRLTDRRLPEILLGTLVANIRMWKPEIILVDEAPSDDALTKLIQKALPQAVEFAKDPQQFPEQLAIGLEPWIVNKVVMERMAGRAGSMTLDLFEILPHLGTTLDVAVQQATSRAFDSEELRTSNRSYEVLYLPSNENYSKATIFNDLRIPANSAARRANPALTSQDFDRLIEEANHRRRVTAITKNLVNSPSGGTQLLAQLGEMLKPLSDEQAARQLAEMALKYREQSQWTMAEETYSQLIINYPNQPDALEAMLWLVKYSTSAEMNWQRLRAVNASNSNSRVDPAAVQANIQKALQIAGKNATQAGFYDEIRTLQRGVDNNATPLIPTLGNSVSVLNGTSPGANQYDLQLRRWHENATTIVNDISASYPRLFEDDEMQFVVAALLRRRQQGRKADEIYGKYLQRLNDDDPWHVAAKGETFLLRPGALSPKPVISCKKTELAPILDGKLIDPCWSNASELKLSERNSTDLFVDTDQGIKGSIQFIEREPIVMFSRDGEYLYLAASIPKHDKMKYDATQHAGRPRDSDLGKHDYIAIQFDVDRDYSTYYRFEIDQRGWTREACWDAWSYNPEWFVATEQDATSWSFEAAIPLKELLPSELNISNVWAVGVTRVVPGVTVQSWTNSGGEKPVAPRFGLMRFN